MPKKSATAKTISKGGTSAPAKSKKYVDTESESEVDDSMSFSMTKLTQKEQKSKKEKEKKSTKSPKEKLKSSGQKSALGVKSSSAKAASMFSGSGSEDTDTSLNRYDQLLLKCSGSPLTSLYHLTFSIQGRFGLPFKIEEVSVSANASSTEVKGDYLQNHNYFKTIDICIPIIGKGK